MTVGDGSPAALNLDEVLRGVTVCVDLYRGDGIHRHVLIDYLDEALNRLKRLP